MTTRIVLFISALLIIVSFFISCENNEYNDNEIPTIEMFEVSDTMYLDSSSVDANYIKIRFTDNLALSSYNIYLKPDPEYFITPNNPIPGVNGADSLAYEGVINSQKADIFGRDSITISRNLSDIRREFQVYNRELGKNITYLVRTGMYLLSIECVDKAGNTNRKDVKSIRILYPDRFYNLQD